MVNLGLSIQPNFSAPKQKTISVDEFMQAAKQAGTDKLPPEEANKQLDAAVEQIRSAGGDVVGWDSLQEVHNTMPPMSQKGDMSTLGKIGAGTTIAGAGLGGSYMLGKGLEKIGKGIYGLGFSESPQAAAKMVRGEKDVRGITTSAIETPGVYGGETRVGNKAYMGQQNIWNKDISPYIKKSVNVIDADTLGKEMLDDIAKGSFSVAKKKQLTEELTQFIDDLKVNYPKGINQQESHLLTSERGKDLESVFKKVGKDVAATPVTNEYKGIVLAARGKLRDKLYTSMENAFKDLGVSKKMIKQKMVDYGNLGKVVAQSEKDLQQRFLGGVLGASSAAIKKVGTPVTTILGKGTYTAGKALQYIPKQIIAGATKGAKAIMKGLKEVVKGGSIFTIFQDGTIIPGSPTNIAQEAIDINKEYSKNPENFVEGEGMLWRKGEIEKAIEKNKKDATMEGEFIDRFGQRRVLRNGEVKTLY